jgi:hypothetical protein
MVPECLAFSPDGRTLVAGGRTGVRLWDAATGKDRLADRPGHSLAPQVLAYAPDGKTIVSGADNGSARLWDARSGKQLRAWEEHDRGVTGAAWGKALVLDAATGERRLEIKGRKVWDQQVAFSPGGGLLALSEGQETIGLYKADSGKLLHALTGKANAWGRACPTFSGDGSAVAASIDGDTTIIVWDVAALRRSGPP